MKLETEKIVGYLPHKLKCEVSNDGEIEIGTLQAVYNNDTVNFGDIVESEHDFDYVKPILVPLDSYKDINSKAMNDLGIDLMDQIQIEKLANRELHYCNMDWDILQICFRNHIDVFRMIEDGLAIIKK